MVTKVKYTPEQEEELKVRYDAEGLTDEERDLLIEDWMAKWGKTKKSLVAKLSKMGIYHTKERVSKVTGGAPETKEQLVKRIADMYNKPQVDFEGLEKAPKLVLLRLLGEK